jgi:hypothetical protein
MSPRHVWNACAGTILLVVVLGLCLVSAADAAPSAPPLCTAVKGEELGASKAFVPSLWAAVATGDLIVLEPLSSEHRLPEQIPPRTPADLRGDLASRAPPIRL